MAPAGGVRIDCAGNRRRNFRPSARKQWIKLIALRRLLRSDPFERKETQFRFSFLSSVSSSAAIGSQISNFDDHNSLEAMAMAIAAAIAIVMIVIIVVAIMVLNAAAQPSSSAARCVMFFTCRTESYLFARPAAEISIRHSSYPARERGRDTAHVTTNTC